MAGDEPLRGERAAWAVLAAAEGVGSSTFGSLLRRFGTASAVLDAARRPGAPTLRRPPADPDPTASDPFRDPATAATLVAGVTAAADGAAAILGRIEAMGLRTLLVDDAGYPARLRATDLAPPVLHVLGDPLALLGERMVAVVGTRRPSEQGRLLAGRVARELVAVGASVVSGLAVGIDGAAHAATLDEAGVTIAVLGSGHARLTPWAHRGLARRIVEASGAIVSEHGPDVGPTRASFPRRNRIISGLADATVVIEAGEGSGALHTARWALEQGRECFIAPGPVGAPTSVGGLRFLREHAALARIVAGLPELVEDLGWHTAPAVSRPTLTHGATAPPPVELGSIERAVLDGVDDGAGTVDQLVLRTGLATATVLGALTRLELRGLVVTALGRYRPAGPRRRARTGGRRAGRGAGRGPRGVGFAGSDGAVLP